MKNHLLSFLFLLFIFYHILKDFQHEEKVISNHPFYLKSQIDGINESCNFFYFCDFVISICKILNNLTTAQSTNLCILLLI